MWLVLKIYLAWVAVISIVAFVTYGWDKRQARNQQQRVSESRLHWITLLGGWPGGLAGQQYFRHKTAKPSFLVVFWILTVLHVAIAIVGGWAISGL